MDDVEPEASDEEMNDVDAKVSNGDLERARGNAPDQGQDSMVEADYLDEGESFDEDDMIPGTSNRVSSTTRQKRAMFGRNGNGPVHSMGISRTHVRGVDTMDVKGAKELRAMFLFGPTNEDLEPVFKTRAKWGRYRMLPPRGTGQLARSFYVHEGAAEKEQERTRDWYWYKGGVHAFTAGQRMRQLSESEGGKYLPEAKEACVLMGPVKDQKLYTLKTGEFIGTAAPFNNKSNRRGWVTNLGAKIHEAQWVPNEEGKKQYLAVVVEQHRPGRPSKPLSEPRAPAFTPHRGYPASIQIWAFDTVEGGELDLDTTPKLELVICTDWGAVKQLRWCPVPASDTVEPGENEHFVHLGLLAGIWTDGRTRVLDISYPKPEPGSDHIYYLHFSRAAFEVLPAYSVSTCMTWMSGTSLAIGTAHGSVAIWTLSREGTFPSPKSTSETQHEPIPWFSKALADSYILSIASGFPSRPNFLSLTSVDGVSRLLDLRSPTFDTVCPPRNRVFGNTQAWHEHTQAFTIPDENYTMRNHTIRRYYMNLHSFSAETQILCCATSPVHPCVLIGGADGIVTAGNPILRVLNAKEIPVQQIWFAHEWRRGIEESNQSNPYSKTQTSTLKNSHTPTTTEPTKAPDTTPFTSNSGTPVKALPPDILKVPLSRIVEGFKPQAMALGPTTTKTARATNNGYLAAIFEEKTAVTCLSWNPNIRFGTWAVAGMADGLMRVEDVGV
ncbi:hypothetical protein GQ43DRAFT_451053 [Delitschia confertaspora ATCC 74209]|uniref:WD domain, G-beta repeat protein n=1 Tax=Delitschia confertaspora ATCC 74209 TaxID=1513339 RepID=A0A9P4JKV0_9PLEO|nr:hypothetical protein GQ43DRAFT_451053 [Delitschia confertaspora ATCC 74209]